MAKMKEHLVYLIGAVVSLYAVLPLLPSVLLIQPQSLAVVGDSVHMTRLVTVPVQGRYTHEWERLSPPPPETALGCYEVGYAHYEWRGLDPIIFKHDCDFDGPSEAEWQFRSCWEAQTGFGTYLRPVCKVITFFPHLPSALKGS